MKKQSLLQGAFILTISGLINRLLGFSLRIILVNLVGDEGLGLFQMVYPIFMTFLLLATAGFPMAISKLIPQETNNRNKKSALKLFQVSLISVSIAGSLLAVIFYFKADFISQRLLSDQRTYYALLAISPVLILSPIASVFRGFFQGLQTMIPTAVSQITEQICRLLSTIAIIYLIGSASLGLKYKSAGIALGVGIGELTGLIILIYLFFRWHSDWRHNNKIRKTDIRKKENPKEFSGFVRTYKKIARLGFPITLGRLIHSLMFSIEAIIIPNQLKISGLSGQEATGLYGQLSGMVEQIIFLPTVITIGLTTSLVPNIAEAYSNNNIKKIDNNYRDIMRIISYMGVPIIFVFTRYSSEICHLLFGYGEAGKLLAGLALSAPFIYYLQVSSGMLNGLGKPMLAVRNMLIGASIKLVIIYLLTGDPNWGITGTTIGMTIGFIISAILNYLSISRKINYTFDLKKIILKPLLSMVGVFFATPYLKLITSYLPFSDIYRFEIIYLLSFTAILYLALMILFRAFTAEDIKRFKF